MHLAAKLSECAHAQIVALDVSACYAFPGVVRVMTWQDVPGTLDIAALTEGDPLLAQDKGGICRPGSGGGGGRRCGNRLARRAGDKSELSAVAGAVGCA
ncbi:hypothetical protein [Serratia odorifera]|uniref:hypothetical protein n=1 Tax=Serratia odorifera TaxID=618 RepID=UPI001F54251E|nr:hypothetical protein [Serratia odorifera]